MDMSIMVVPLIPMPVFDEVDEGMVEVVVMLIELMSMMEILWMARRECE